MTHSEYEVMMVNLCGGIPTAKRVVQTEVVPPSVESKPVAFVVQNEDSFRESFMERLFKRGAALRIVG